MAVLQLVILFTMITSSHGFFEWENCVSPSTNITSKPLKAHGCEDGDDVILSCAKGHKLAIVKVFFGHGHGHKSTCDNSWFGQNCGANVRQATNRVKLLCQDKQKCVISPTSAVLGSTSCTFGLDSDLFVDYVCNREYIPDVISIRALDISPSPLILPGTVNVSGSVTVKRHLPSTTKLKLHIEKKVGLWVTVPCIANYGSCTYENFCELLRGVMNSKCDAKMENTGIPCDCPIPTGTFTLPVQSIVVTKEHIQKIPVWNKLVEGKYRVKAEFLDAYDRHVGCITVQAEVDITTKKKKRSVHIKWFK